MRYIIVALIWLIHVSQNQAQHSLIVSVMDEESGLPLIGATVVMENPEKGVVTNDEGLAVFRDLSGGTYTISISYIGYEEFKQVIRLPLDEAQSPLIIRLHHHGEDFEEVIISSTRSSRTIRDIPTRIEFIAGEELAEKGNMKPGDIRMLLNESTGIQTQQTSATSYNSSIRIQGLDGKYTQLLRDGFPLFSGFSGGLSLMQIAPLDLKQVEVIKGASSTLYGGGAIAGLVNLISKTPGEERDLSFMVNGTSALGLDASGFYSEQFGKAGTTIFASFNKGRAYDPAGIGLTAIPEFTRFTLNPKFFLYPGKGGELMLGINMVAEDRLGGNLAYIRDNQVANPYFEENKTRRFSSQSEYKQPVGERGYFNIRNSVSYYGRSISVPQFNFGGVQWASYSEWNYRHSGSTSEWIVGNNLWTDAFNQTALSELSLDYSNYTAGFFVQNTWKIAEKITTESGLRLDYHSEAGIFPLPMFSILFEPNDRMAIRTGGGLGYKPPTIFSEEAERLHFRNILPIPPAEANTERSSGVNMDVNYRWPVTDYFSINTNLLLFYTRIDRPLTLVQNRQGFYAFQPLDGFFDTKGLEVNLKASYQDFKLFVGYTYADVLEHSGNTTSVLPLVAKHRLNNVLMYEQHDNLWIGLEAYYFSPQQLSDGAEGRDYWILGLMGEKALGEHFSVFLNFENFLDTRQTAFDEIFSGSIDNPQFRDIYAPVDGFVINGGFKVRL